ncbi:MAG: hypothetical protein LBB23_03305 [Rickettsiales bacterium]|jgi:hypothetical protein|nr:hypothetical protein [Rickettsiales bacterium]
MPVLENIPISIRRISKKQPVSRQGNIAFAKFEDKHSMLDIYFTDPDTNRQIFMSLPKQIIQQLFAGQPR